jgi:hypothetical protein
MKITQIAKMFDVEVVKYHEFDTNNRESFLNLIASLEGSEGVVLAFPDGHRTKIKSHEYVLLHRTLDQITKEKTLIPLIIGEKLDDAKPLLAEDVVEKVDKFSKDFYYGVEGTVNEIYDILHKFFDIKNEFFNSNKKNFAVNIVNHQKPHLRPFLFKAYDYVEKNGMTEVHEKIHDMVIDTILKGITTFAKCDTTRILWGGYKWEDYYYEEKDEEIINE